MTDTPDRLERTLEVLLYAPLGIGLFLKDSAPTFVDMFVSRGRAEVDQRVTTARSLGQVALAFGPPVIRKKVEEKVADARDRVGSLFGSSTTGDSGRAPNSTTAPEPAPPPAAPVADTISDAAAVAEPQSNGDLASSSALPIPGYDALSASQVVERLIGLAPDELDAVHAYEATHRQRRTILGKIEQLAG
jgi:hypothetical protein